MFQHALLHSANRLLPRVRACALGHLVRGPAGASLLLCAATLLPGCTSSMVSRRTIEQFAESIAAKDVTELREACSDSFEQRALRRADAIQDLRVLNLPTGKTTVLEVEDVSPTRKLVHVEVGEQEQGHKLDFELVLDPVSRRWVVNDVLRTNGDTPLEKSAAAQMDMLLTVREFLDAWRSQKTEQVLAVATPELRGLLGELPEAWLTQTAAHMVESAPHRGFRPDARMDGDRAVVAIGKLMVELHHVNDKWLVHDASLEDHDDTVRSVRKLAAALTQSRRFLEAYSAGDMPNLQAATTPEFHDKCLVAADLRTVPLPAKDLLEARYEARQQKLHVDLLFEHGETTYMLSLKLNEGDNVPGKSVDITPHVEEVTIYESGTDEVKRMSAMFLTHATVYLFAEMLQERDRPMLENLSTLDFSRRVWRRTNNDVLRAIPLPEIENETPKILATVYNGEITEVTVAQGARSLVYVLRMSDGQMHVDDVLMPVLDRPTSLKQNLEQIIPVFEFAMAAYSADREKLISASAEGLDRIVWKQLRENPDLVALTGYHLPQWLALPVEKVEVNGRWSTVTLGNGKQQTEVKLTQEGDRFLVHDVTLLAGPTDSDRIELMTTMRRLMANSMSTPGRLSPMIAAQKMPRPESGVVPASAEDSGSGSKIQQAVFEEVEIE